MFKNKKGFTLIELLVVIAIIGTLSGIVLVSLGDARKKARDAVRQSDIRQIVSAQEMYYGDEERYLKNDGSGDGTPAVSTYLHALDDPQEPDQHYTWVNNTGALDCDVTPDMDTDAGEWFCAYAALEEGKTSTDTAYFCASHRGTKKLAPSANPPTTNTLCTCF